MMTSLANEILLLAASILLCSPVLAARGVPRSRAGNDRARLGNDRARLGNDRARLGNDRARLGNEEIQLVPYGGGVRVRKGRWVRARRRTKSGVRIRKYCARNGRELGSVIGEMFSIPNAGTWKLTQKNINKINDALSPKKKETKRRKTRTPVKYGTADNGKRRGDRTLLSHEEFGEKWDAIDWD